MRSLPSSSKGQFFIVSAVSIVIILFFIGRWLEPSTVPDTSSIALTEELFTFDNVKEKATAVVKGSESCEELDYNLQEYKNFLNDFAREKNYQIGFVYSIEPCSSSAIARVNLTLVSEKVNAKSNFSIQWP